MPQCSDYGEGWSGEYPNCTYSAPSFGGGVESLGFQDILPSQVQGTPWSEFFDPYDPARQQMAEAGAGIDVGQLQSAWDLQQQQLGEAYGLQTGQLGEAYGLQTGQLGETWGVQKTALGAGAGRGVRGTRRSGAEAMRKGRLAYSGTAVEAQRTAEADVMAEYTGGMQAGQTAYQQALGTAQLGYEQALGTAEMGYGQALETGQLGVTQATTDIGQQLQEDIFGYQEAWEREQRGTLNVLLGMDIWGEGGGGGGNNDEVGNVTCCDGSTVVMATQCGAGNMPWECGDTGGNGGGDPPDEPNPCPDPNNSYQCPDGSCVSSQMQCL
jgi:hypothetical protein